MMIDEVKEILKVARVIIPKWLAEILKGLSISNRIEDVTDSKGNIISTGFTIVNWGMGYTNCTDVIKIKFFKKNKKLVMEYEKSFDDFDFRRVKDSRQVEKLEDIKELIQFFLSFIDARADLVVDWENKKIVYKGCEVLYDD